MGKRHEAIGIKQVVRLEWYELALNLLLDGQRENDIRNALDDFISERKQSGGYGDRGGQTYPQAVTQIMKCWVKPEKHLIAFRDDLLEYARKGSKKYRIALHWAITSAAYPFWFRMALLIGRLLNLQNSITQSQIRLRSYEATGERSTVERSGRRVVRTFVEWGYLRDSEVRGCYEKNLPLSITEPDLAILMLESALYATPEAQGALGLLLNNPAFFPFRLPVMTGDFISQHSQRIDVVRYALDDELLQLRFSE